MKNKDKVCTDGKDDGKLSAGQYALSFSKGLIGGIPKAMINHPVATVAALAVGGAAIFLSGGAILPVLGAVGVATGVGMVGYGGYKAVTAKTDGEAKQALETMGMGITTTALSVAAADKALEKAAEAGVKSAQVSEDAGILDKTVQMFKAIPECLTKSKEWTKFNLGLNVQGTYKNFDRGILLEEKTPAGTVKKYEIIKGSFSKPKPYSVLKEEQLADGSYRKYDVRGGYFSKAYSVLEEEQLADGTYRKYDVRLGQIKDYGVLREEQLADGTKIKYYKGEIKHVNKPNGTRQVFCKDNIVEETLPGGKTQYSWDKLKRIPKGTDIYKLSGGGKLLYYPDRRVICYNADGSIKYVSSWSYGGSSSSSSSSSSGGYSGGQFLLDCKDLFEIVTLQW